jgi:surfeit locus 1 family protein
MTKRVPVLATLLVAVAVAVMIALGVWQLQRAQWKDGLVERYSNADTLPPIAFPTGPLAGDLPLFRWATANCLRPVAHRATAGANRQGEPGYVHIVRCSTGAEGPGIAIELGWAKDPRAKFDWPGGPVTGLIAPDSEQRIRLVAASAPAGLQPSAYPSVATIPRNHRMYAATWFAFAAIALLIFVIALRRKWRSQ